MPPATGQVQSIDNMNAIVFAACAHQNDWFNFVSSTDWYWRDDPDFCNVFGSEQLVSIVPVILIVIGLTRQ